MDNQNLSLKEKARIKNVTYLMVYHDLLWFFSNKNKHLDAGFSRVDAEVFSALINAENLSTARLEVDARDYFMCTASYINRKLDYTEATVLKSLKRLQMLGLIDCSTIGGRRYVHIYEEVWDIIIARYREYEDALLRFKFDEMDFGRDVKGEQGIYDKYTALVVQDMERMRGSVDE